MRVPPERRPRPISQRFGALLRARRVQESITVEELVAELGHDTARWVDQVETSERLGPGEIRVYHAAIARVLATRAGMRAEED